MSDHDPGPALAELAALDPPVLLPQLDARISAIAEALEVTAARARTLVSSAIVAQMLPPATAVKGGMGIKLRLGETGTRATRDIDVVAREREAFEAEVARRLEVGWGEVPPTPLALNKDAEAPPRVAFTGTIRARQQATPPGVPPHYVMQPYKVSLKFIGAATNWPATPLEVVHDEIDGSEIAEPDHVIAAQVSDIAAALGCGALAPVPLLSLEQQIAQKIHAVTEAGADRPRDLVDLQLLWSSAGDSGIDMPLLAQMCRRTFEYRQRHEWPPVDWAPPAAVTLWSAGYEVSLEEAAGAGGLIPAVQDAVSWLDGRIAEIEAAGS